MKYCLKVLIFTKSLQNVLDNNGFLCYNNKYRYKML